MHAKEQRQAMQEWLITPLGKRFLRAEAAVMERALRRVFGYHLLVVGEPPFMECVESSAIGHRVLLHPYLDSSVSVSLLLSRQDQLPIQSDSIDALYLAHSLETASNPHEVIREASRVLLPEGQLFITGFNAKSLWIWNWLFNCALKKAPWCLQWLSQNKVKDWLALLGFDVIEERMFFFRPPITNPGVFKKLNWLEKKLRKWCPFLGSGYMIKAQKRVIPLTPIKPLKAPIKEVVIDEWEPT